MSYEHDYFTDLITNRSISFIRRAKASRPDSPFLAVLSHSAPHGPETAAPQYSTAFPDAKAPRYNYNNSATAAIYNNNDNNNNNNNFFNEIIIISNKISNNNNNNYFSIK